MYNQNRPLINSILIGTLYLLFCWSIDYIESLKLVFMGLMLFLPGLTFPLTTTYPLEESQNQTEKRILHTILSVSIYHGSVWLFSGEGRIKWITLLAGFAGSLGYLVITRLILKYRFSFLEIFVTTLFSGLAFLPYELIGREPLLMALAIFLWTIVNGFLINLKYKTTSTNPVYTSCFG